MHGYKHMGAFRDILCVISHPFELLAGNYFIIRIIAFVKYIVEHDIIIPANIERIVCRAEIFLVR